MTPFQTLYHEWEGFYQMAAECSATLMGLMFVVATQGANYFDRRAIGIVRTFLSPILGYYMQSLFLSALLCIPNQTQHRLLVEVVLFAALRGYMIMRIFGQFRELHRLSRLPLDKWVHHIGLPCLALPMYLLAGAVIDSQPELALTILATVVLYGLILGILEAWRLVLFMAETDPEEVARAYENYTKIRSTVVTVTTAEEEGELSQIS